MPRDIDTIMQNALAALRPLLQEAYDAGRHEGRREATGQLQNLVAGALDSMQKMAKVMSHGPEVKALPPSVVASVQGTATGSSTAVGHAEAVRDESRALAGTVKPRIAQALREHPDGLSVAEITAMTGFKKNSVRGTLWTIKQDGEAERRGERWFAIQKEKAADAESRQDTSAALSQPEAQGREAGPGGGT